MIITAWLPFFKRHSFVGYLPILVTLQVVPQIANAGKVFITKDTNKFTEFLSAFIREPELLVILKKFAFIILNIVLSRDSVIE